MKEIPYNKFTRHQFNAFLGHHLTFASYFGCYEIAFEALIEKIYQSGNHVDLLAYPILFIDRHCMELGFKTNIRYFLKCSEKDDFNKAGTHDLEKLFGAFKLHIDETIKTLNRSMELRLTKQIFRSSINISNRLTN